MTRPISKKNTFNRLDNLGKFLGSFHVAHQSTFFEELIVQSFPIILHLPFFDITDDDSTIAYRVTWNGSRNLRTRAPGGGPDGIGRGRGFNIIIEATLKTGTKQWSQEFAISLKHARDTNDQYLHVNPELIITVLVTPAIHDYTYNSVKHNNQSNPYKIIPIETIILKKLVETSRLAFTLRHLDIRDFFNNIINELFSSYDCNDYRKRSISVVNNWQKEVLQLEKKTIIPIKSYHVMRKINRNHISTSEILRDLANDKFIKKYSEKVKEGFGAEIINQCIVQESLGKVLSKINYAEHIFAPVPISDFRSRCKWRSLALENFPPD